MVKIALVCLALVCGQVLSGPTPANTFPEKFLGSYQAQPESDQNFDQFLTAIKGPQTDAAKTGLFSIWKEGEQYHAKLTFGPDMPVHTLTFKLGETQTTTFNGKPLEYVYTVEGGETESPVLKGKFRCVETDKKYTVDATFNPNGIVAAYNVEGVTARRTYAKIPCPSILGYYVNVPEKQSANFLEFIGKVVPAPKGITWDEKTGLWLGAWKGDLVVKYIITPSVYVKFPFKLNEERTKEVDGHTVTYKYTLVGEDHTTHTTTLHGEFTGPTGKLTLDAVITPEGITTTYKHGDQTATRYWKRCTSPMVYGTYEAVPESAENWSEFTKAAGKDDDSKDLTKIQVYKKDNKMYFRVAYTSGKSHVYPVELNKTLTATMPNGTPLKYTWNENHHYTGEPQYHVEYEAGEKKFSSELTFNATGFTGIYKTGSITAKRFHRRTLPTIVLGKFESAPETTPEFTEFAKAIGSPELTAKTTVEITEPKNKDHKYDQTITVEGSPTPGQFPFALGQATNVTLKGKELTYHYFYFDHPVPVLHVYWHEANHGPMSFTVAGEYTPTGYTATYLYKGKVATRKYTRVGAPVERETYPTA